MIRSLAAAVLLWTTPALAQGLPAAEAPPVPGVELSAEASSEVALSAEAPPGSEVAPPVPDAPSPEDVDVGNLLRRLEDQEAELAELRKQLESRQEQLEVRTETLQVFDEVFDEVEEVPERVSFGSSTHIRPGERVGEAVAFGGDVLVEGHVTGDATAFGGNITVEDGAVIDGDAVSFGGAVRVDQGGVVHGDKVGFGQGGPLVVNTSASAPKVVHHHHKSRSMLSSLYRRLVFLLSFLGAGVLVVGLLPDRVGRIATDLEKRPIRAALVGIFASLALLFAAVLFAITILGLPVTFLIVSVLGLAWLVGFVGICQAIGDRLPFLSKPHGRWVAFLVGALLVSLVGALPFIGGLLVFVASLVGVGAALGTRFGSPARG